MLVWRGWGWLVVGLAMGIAFAVYRDGESAKQTAWGDVYFYVALTCALAVSAFFLRNRKTKKGEPGLKGLFSYQDTFFWLPMWVWSALSGVGTVVKLVAALKLPG